MVPGAWFGRDFGKEIPVANCLLHVRMEMGGGSKPVWRRILSDDSSPVPTCERQPNLTAQCGRTIRSRRCEPGKSSTEIKNPRSPRGIDNTARRGFVYKENFTIMVVSLSTGRPFSRQGVYRQNLTASIAAWAKIAFPLTL